MSKHIVLDKIYQLDPFLLGIYYQMCSFSFLSVMERVVYSVKTVEIDQL